MLLRLFLGGLIFLLGFILGFLFTNLIRLIHDKKKKDFKVVSSLYNGIDEGA